MVSEKSGTSYSRLEWELDAMVVLTTILFTDWTAFTWKSSDGSPMLLVSGSPKPKWTPEEESPSSSSENPTSLGEQSWTSPPSFS